MRRAGKRATRDTSRTGSGLIPAHAGKTDGRTGQHWRAGAHPRSRGKTRTVTVRCIRLRAHPRSRGENVSIRVWMAAGGGSSPLTRGKRRGGARRVRLAVAHPRSRGENEGGDGFGDPLAGSSPLTRGKPHEDVEAIPERRLIPAHAGKTAESVAPHGTKQAHPRSRGENFVGWPALACLWGSSPLTRGKRIMGQQAARGQGLIPAHAGKTQRWFRRWRSPGAHPRSRGENGYLSVFRVTGLGSSPLTRGKLAQGRDRARDAGLIPAHAGKTRVWGPRRRSPLAHPRSRGENTEADEDSRALWGSSPLTRGKPLSNRCHWDGVGLIPAHAGKTRSLSCPFDVVRAHPRSRGENCMTTMRTQTPMGSSPLTRGKHGGELGVGRGGGLIPAHAGKT